MIACVQRCSRAAVRVEDRDSGSIGRGLLVLIGVEMGDDGARAEKLAQRLLGLRIFEDETGRMNRSVCDVGGEVLVVSQFTLAPRAIAGGDPPSIALHRLKRPVRSTNGWSIDCARRAFASPPDRSARAWPSSW
jgi:D-tyrosyl-tRNA(Tyr) deacylase